VIEVTHRTVNASVFSRMFLAELKDNASSMEWCMTVN